MTLPDALYLMGNEDCEVDLHCSECPWAGGLPIAHYDRHGQGAHRSYSDVPEVVQVQTLTQLVDVALTHAHRTAARR